MLKYIAASVVGGALLGSAIWEIIDPEKKLAAKKAAVNRAVNTLKNNGVTCHCGGLAIPTEQRGKIRRCVRCTKQFASSGYNLGETHTHYEKLDMTHYDDAVEMIKEELKY